MRRLKFANKLSIQATGRVPSRQQSKRFVTTFALPTRRRLKVVSSFLMAGPAWPRQSLCWFSDGRPAALCLDSPLCHSGLPRRHIGATCGGSRTPTVGRCSRERRLKSFGGAPTRRNLNWLRHALTGRRGLLTRPSLLFLRKCVQKKFVVGFSPCKHDLLSGGQHCANLRGALRQMALSGPQPMTCLTR